MDEKIEWTYYELWHHEGRRARQGSKDQLQKSRISTSSATATRTSRNSVTDPAAPEILSCSQDVSRLSRIALDCRVAALRR
jgi:hypothetical protein